MGEPRGRPAPPAEDRRGARRRRHRPRQAAGEGGSGTLRGELFAIRGAILDWEGRSEEALESYRKALDADPDSPETLYTLYRQAVSLGDDETADRALEHLVEVRPENFVVLVERGKRAIQQDDRAAATEVFLRLRELLWQAPPVAGKALDSVLEALEQGETPIAQAARVPAARLENVLKVTPMYRESLRALSTGIQAVPVRRFATAPPAMEFGEPLEIRFAGERLAEAATVGGALALADLDGDGVTDTARIVERPAGAPAGAGADGPPARLEVRLSSDQAPPPPLPAPAATGLLAVDLYNDGGIDLLAYGPGGAALWNGTLSDGAYSLAPAAGAAAPSGPDGSGAASGRDAAPSPAGLAAAAGTAATVLDYDIEGDLDLLLGGGDAPVELYRNNLEGPLEAVGAKVLPDLAGFTAEDAVAADLDRDGDTDLLLAGHAHGRRRAPAARQPAPGPLRRPHRGVRAVRRPRRGRGRRRRPRQRRPAGDRHRRRRAHRLEQPGRALRGQPVRADHASRASPPPVRSATRSPSTWTTTAGSTWRSPAHRPIGSIGSRRLRPGGRGVGCRRLPFAAGRRLPGAPRPRSTAPTWTATATSISWPPGRTGSPA